MAMTPHPPYCNYRKSKEKPKIAKNNDMDNGISLLISPDHTLPDLGTKNNGVTTAPRTRDRIYTIRNNTCIKIHFDTLHVPECKCIVY